MNCPFCQQEMLLSSLRDGDEEHQMWHCLSCQLSAQGKVWQELTRTRKALEVAVDALEEYEDADSYDNDGNWCGPKYSTAHHALEQITALEQKE